MKLVTGFSVVGRGANQRLCLLPYCTVTVVIVITISVFRITKAMRCLLKGGEGGWEVNLFVVIIIVVEL